MTDLWTPWVAVKLGDGCAAIMDADEDQVGVIDSYEVAEAIVASVNGGVWHPIATAEKTSKARLVWCPQYQNTYVVSWDDYETQWVIFGGSCRLNEMPTHWQPLPAAPVAA